jgi:Transcriptional regulator containing an amidase domain and an AraC-type DNA-binding HTH domain
MENYHKYLSIGGRDDQWGFYATTAGYSRIDPKQAYPNNNEHPANHTFTWNTGRILDGYYLVYITKGQGVFESAHTGLTTITTGTCFFLFPDEWHRYKPDPNSGWEEYWVGYKGSYPNELMNKDFFRRESPFVHVGLNGELLELFRKLLDTMKSPNPELQQVIPGIILQMLGLVSAISRLKECKNDPTNKLISEAKYLMQQSLEKAVKIEELVKDLPIGYSKFRKAFKESTGFSPKQYYLNLRLNRAKELLASTALTVNEVAYLTGFESVFHFSRLFKQKYGKSPKQYRSEVYSAFT